MSVNAVNCTRMCSVALFQLLLVLSYGGHWAVLEYRTDLVSAHTKHVWRVLRGRDPGVSAHGGGQPGAGWGTLCGKLHWEGFPRGI